MFVTMDAANAAFELIGSVMVVPSILIALKHKKVVGIHLSTPLFFWFLGIWHLLYYSGLEQWSSTCASVMMVTTNTIWLIMVFKYGRRME